MSSVKLVVHWICGLIAVMAYTYLICKISYAHGREEGSGGSQKPRCVMQTVTLPKNFSIYRMRLDVDISFVDHPYVYDNFST